MNGKIYMIYINGRLAKKKGTYEVVQEETVVPCQYGIIEGQRPFPMLGIIDSNLCYAAMSLCGSVSYNENLSINLNVESGYENHIRRTQ